MESFITKTDNLYLELPVQTNYRLLFVRLDFISVCMVLVLVPLRYKCLLIIVYDYVRTLFEETNPRIFYEKGSE